MNDGGLKALRDDLLKTLKKHGFGMSLDFTIYSGASEIWVEDSGFIEHKLSDNAVHLLEITASGRLVERKPKKKRKAKKK